MKERTMSLNGKEYPLNVIKKSIATCLISGKYRLDIEGEYSNYKTQEYLTLYGEDYVKNTLKDIGFSILQGSTYINLAPARNYKEQDAIVINSNIACYVKLWLVRGEWLVDAHLHN